MAGNLIQHGDFAAGRLGHVPTGWERQACWPRNAPSFRLVSFEDKRWLLAAGNGADDCFGYLRTPVRLSAGKTYRLRVRLQVSPDLNPQQHLRFSVFTKSFNDGIFRFRRTDDSWVTGEGLFLYPGPEDADGEVRITFCFSAQGRAWIREITLEETASLPPRPVRVACVQGNVALAKWERVVDAAARQHADLVLLPETINGATVESLRGATCQLLAGKARQHRMYVAGGFHYRDPKAHRVYNTVALFDRGGRLVGRYAKVHPYTPELWTPPGDSPGREVPVFRTDFGVLGIMICYDSWFTDVAELLALKGAEVILFPNAGYCRSIIPARAADNGVRIVASSWGSGAGIWDTAGREVTDPERDPTVHANCPPAATAYNVYQRRIGAADLLIATLDLAQSPSPHNWGGPLLSAPGGRRNRREQVRLLYDDLRRETERWWVE